MLCLRLCISTKNSTQHTVGALAASLEVLESPVILPYTITVQTCDHTHFLAQPLAWQVLLVADQPCSARFATQLDLGSVLSPSAIWWRLSILQG